MTTMELRLHPIGPMVVAGLIYRPLDQFSNLVDHHRSLMDEFSEDLTTWIFLRVAPPQHLGRSASMLSLRSVSPKSTATMFEGDPGRVAQQIMDALSERQL